MFVPCLLFTGELKNDKWGKGRGRVGRGAQDFLIKMRSNRYRGGCLEKHVVLFFSLPYMKK